MIYLDSNVFVYAATDDGARGKTAAKVLGSSVRGGACTATLTLDEVLRATAKKIGRKAAAGKVRQLMALDLELVPVEKRDVEMALGHFEDGLDARDAIHAAVALRRGCMGIVSTDEAFAKVKGLRHIAY
ncbi:MAG TPA: type II toxin-antitoxin system VapC family toxin [Candidatus Thermoplasmatota archaeon]|nr:type II toxin-antitoxin system VapC family toxin [Candidatus Thermoplasmatota archaeon]